MRNTLILAFSALVSAIASAQLPDNPVTVSGDYLATTASITAHNTNAAAHAGLFDAAGSAAAVSNALAAGAAAGLAYTGTVTAAQATNIAAAVVAPYTNHQSRTDNPHSVTAAQVGAVATNDAAYLAALTNAQFAAQDGVTITGRTLNIGTNLLGGGTGGGTLQDAVTAQGGTPVTNVPALTLASGAALSMSGTLSALGATNNVGYGAGASATGDYMHNFGLDAGFSVSGDFMHNFGYSAGHAATGDYMHNWGFYAGFSASGDYMHNWGFYAGAYGNATNAHSCGPWAGRNAAGSNQLYIGAHNVDPGAGWNPTNDQIYINGNTGDMSLGHPASTNRARARWEFDSADLAFFGGESLADYVAAHGGGGTSLVIEASSSIAVVTSGVTRTLSVKTGVFQPTNSTLTTLAGGTATPILGTGATQAAAGDHTHADYITAATATGIAQTVAWTPGLTPFALTYAATVTVTRAMLATNAASLTLTGNTVLSLATNGWTTAEIARWSLDINRGTNTLAFNTAVYDNTTVLDVTAARVALFFRKGVGESKHKVRQ